MKNEKTNWHLISGLLLFSINNGLKHCIILPEFVHGLLTGISLVLILFGIYAVKHDIKILTRWKKNLIKGITRT